MRNGLVSLIAQKTRSPLAVPTLALPAQPSPILTRDLPLAVNARPANTSTKRLGIARATQAASSLFQVQPQSSSAMATLKVITVARRWVLFPLRGLDLPRVGHKHLLAVPRRKVERHWILRNLHRL